MKRVVILGTLDTKGKEFKFIKEIIESMGCQTLVINVGVKGKPVFEPDIASERVAEAGGMKLSDLIEKDDRGTAIKVMMKGAEKVVSELFQKNEINGIISLGGSAGTTIASAAMRILPVGVPKVMVSTVASGDIRSYVGVKDIMMMYSVTDISGLNIVSRKILSNAAFAIGAMVKNSVPAVDEEKTLIAATMFGVTTPCVTKAREYLEKKGYEVLVFHATGTGGQAMETLIESGFIAGVLDLTTTEWCDELVGGILNAGPYRLEAAAGKGIPQVVSTGALDMVNFGSLDSVPEKFRHRNLYEHNPSVTLMRTTKEENKKLGKIIAKKLNQAEGPTALFLPLKGVSLYDVKGKPFYGPEEDKALFESLRQNINEDKVELFEIDTDINDEKFALEAAKKLVELLENK